MSPGKIAFCLIAAGWIAALWLVGYGDGRARYGAVYAGLVDAAVVAIGDADARPE